MLDLLTGFIQELRAAGLPVSTVEAIDAATALCHTDLGDRQAVRASLAATLVKSARYLDAFGTTFDVFFGPRPPDPGSEEAAARFAESVDALGFDSVAMYNMGGLDEDYLVHGANSLKIREQRDSVLKVPIFACVSIGWDDTPRFPAKGMKDVVHYHNTPESFAALLSKAKEYADDHPDQPKLITVFSWNEWVEGSYLLPDMKYGFGHLEAVKKVISGNYDKYNKK